MRAEEMARLRGSGAAPAGPRSIRRVAEPSDYMKNVVERFSLQKAFADENTVDAAGLAGYRGQGPLTTYLFLRFVTPFVAVRRSASRYLSFIVFADRPL